MKKSEITIGTRKSGLALIQTHYVRDLLTARHAGLAVDVRHIVTKGDKILDVPLAKIGGKGLFTKEIENALLAGEVDIAVHSYKDLPTKLPGGLKVGAVMERAPSEDALIAPAGMKLEKLTAGMRIGTSSLRRRAQLLNKFPELNIIDLRGNVNTRIDKYLAGDYDALILAYAGVMRMGLDKHIAEIISHDDMLPAVAQGALAVEIREDDAETLELLKFLEHPETRAATDAERAFLGALEGGCQVPIGAAGKVAGGALTLKGFAASIDGHSMYRGAVTGDLADAAAIGKELADILISQGADKVLAEIRRAAGN